MGLAPPAVEALLAHFEYADNHGKTWHGLSRVAWLETLDLDPAARPLLIESEEGFERWDGHGALGYLVLEEIVRATLADPPDRARVVVARRCFPTGVLGYWGRRLAEGGLVAVLTATSPRRLAHPDGGDPLTGTNPLAIAIPSSDGQPVVADASMGAVTHGAVLAGAALPGGARAVRRRPVSQGVRARCGSRAPRLCPRRARARRRPRRRAPRSRPGAGIPRAGGRPAAPGRRLTRGRHTRRLPA